MQRMLPLPLRSPSPPKRFTRTIVTVSIPVRTLTTVAFWMCRAPPELHQNLNPCKKIPAQVGAKPGCRYPKVGFLRAAPQLIESSLQSSPEPTWAEKVCELMAVWASFVSMALGNYVTYSWGPGKYHQNKEIEILPLGVVERLHRRCKPPPKKGRFTTQDYTVLYCTVLYCTVLYCTVLYCTVLYCTVLYCTVLYCTVLYCTVLYSTVHYCTVLYSTLLYCPVLYYTVLY